MITEDESWREKFSEKSESEGRDGYRPQHYGSENNYPPRYNAQGRTLRPRINRPAFSSNSEGQVSRPYQPRPRYNAGGEGGYQPRQSREGGYQPRPRYNAGGEGYSPKGGDRGGFRPRTGGYNRVAGSGYAPKGGRPGMRPRTGGYNPNAKYSMKKQIEYKETHISTRRLT